MTGVVLCGGQSTRMGRDKGLLRYEEITWVELAAKKLAAVDINVVLSVNIHQAEQYTRLCKDLLLVKDDDSLPFGGPLKGILSVHDQFPDEDLLVLACDMRDMQPVVLEHLVSVHSTADVQALVFSQDDVIEPLCAIYTAEGLNKIQERYYYGQLVRFSMHAILQHLYTCYLPIPQDWKLHFKNFNTPADLNPLEV